MDGSEEQLCGIFSWLLWQEGNQKCPEKLLGGAVGLRQNISARNRLQHPAGETLSGTFLIVRPLCFLLEHLILALASSKTCISLMGCGKPLLHSFYPGTVSWGASLPFHVKRSRSRECWGERGSRLRPAWVFRWEQMPFQSSEMLCLRRDEWVEPESPCFLG